MGFISTMGRGLLPNIPTVNSLPGINFSIGRGSVNFTQLGFKMGSKIEIIENLKFFINMNYRFKSVRQQESYVDSNSNGIYDEGDNFTDTIENGIWDERYYEYFNNYSFGIDLRYNF